MPLYVLSIGAHPDDNELSVGGTAALFRRRGDEVRLVSVTDGSKGHYTPEYVADPESLAHRRYEEATAAANVIGAEYHTMGLPDGEVYITPANTEEMVRVIRSFGPEGVGPDLVLLNRPCDYHRDHRLTAQLVLDAIYMLTVPPMCPDTRFMNRMPVVAYWHDYFTEYGAFRADVAVPIDSVIEQKIDMVAAHESQVFEWLPFNSGRLSEVPATPAARRAWIGQRVFQGGERQREQYGTLLPADSGARYVEAFQISEYGRQPSPEEIAQLFPIGG